MHQTILSVEKSVTTKTSHCYSTDSRLNLMNEARPETQYLVKQILLLLYSTHVKSAVTVLGGSDCSCAMSGASNALLSSSNGSDGSSPDAETQTYN